MTILEFENWLTSTVADELQIDYSIAHKASDIYNELGADSYNTVHIVEQLEQKFRIPIPDSKLGQMTLKSVPVIIEEFIRLFPRAAIKLIKTQILHFRFREDGKIKVQLTYSDGINYFSNGLQDLPTTLYLTGHNHWSSILLQLEEMINDPTCRENDLQKFFELNPELVAGDDYDVVIPQACITPTAKAQWRADFALVPKDQYEFAKILELKLPTVNIVNKVRSGHASFSAKLWKGIMQVRDYGRAFDSTSTRARFNTQYGVDVYKPDLHLIAGRKWDLMVMESAKSILRETTVKVENWDSLIDRLRRRYTEGC